VLPEPVIHLYPRPPQRFGMAKAGPPLTPYNGRLIGRGVVVLQAGPRIAPQTVETEHRR
jgi:hypothetical protein